MTDIVNLKDRIDADAWTFSANEITACAPEGFPPGTRSFRVVLGFEGATMTSTFHQGPAVLADPELSDVLECLLSDTSGYLNADNLEDYASEYGMDDLAEAERIYRVVEAQADELRDLLGERFDAYVRNTDTN